MLTRQVTKINDSASASECKAGRADGRAVNLGEYEIRDLNDEINECVMLYW